MSNFAHLPFAGIFFVFLLSISNIHAAGNWSRCGGLEGGGIASIVVDPQTPTTVYAAAGNAGV